MKTYLLLTLVCGSIALQMSHAGVNFCLLTLGNETYKHLRLDAPIHNADLMRNWTIDSTSVAFGLPTHPPQSQLS
jgi:hypothetical protein